MIAKPVVLTQISVLHRRLRSRKYNVTSCSWLHIPVGGRLAKQYQFKRRLILLDWGAGHCSLFAPSKMGRSANGPLADANSRSRLKNIAWLFVTIRVAVALPARCSWHSTASAFRHSDAAMSRLHLVRNTKKLSLSRFKLAREVTQSELRQKQSLPLHWHR